MGIRDQNLESVAPILATFKIKATNGVDDLKDVDLGKPVKISASNEIAPLANGEQLLGKLVALTLSDNDNGKRLATVQVGGICKLAVSGTAPVVGNRLVGGTNTGTVRQAPALTGNDPAGGNIARGTVLEVIGTTECVVLLN